MQTTKILLAFFMISNLFASAQNHLVGIKGGINNSNITDRNTFDSKIGKKGFSGGLTYEYNFKKKFALGVDLLYSQKGFGNYYILGDQLDPIKGGTGAPGGITVIYFQYDYIIVPITFSYTIGSKVFLFTAVGLAPCYLVNAKNYLDNEEDKPFYTNKLNKFELSGQLELGFGYQFKTRLKIFASVSKFQSFNGINNANYFMFSEMTNYGYNASIGMKYIIKKKKKPSK